MRFNRNCIKNSFFVEYFWYPAQSRLHGSEFILLEAS